MFDQNLGIIKELKPEDYAVIFKAIIQFSKDGLFVSDQDGNVVMVNRASAEMQSFNASEILGRNVRDLVQEGYYDRSVTLEVLKQKRAVSLIQTNRNKTKILSTGIPIFDDRGKIKFVLVNDRDITFLSRLIESLEEDKISENTYRFEFSDLGMAITIIGWQGLLEDNLNLDSSVLIHYGNQEGAKRGYNPKKRGRPSHHPLLAFLGSGYVVNVWNRSGDTGTGQGAVSFFHQTLILLGEDFRINRILCDSGFYLIDFIEYLGQKRFSYIIGVSISHPIQREILQVRQWKKVSKGVEVGEFTFQHQDPKWTQPRRYIVAHQSIYKRPKALGKQPSLFKDLEDWSQYRISVMITNDCKSTPEEIWRQYRPRASDENVVKDLKEGYGFETFNVKNFWATEAVLMMIALVFHNLIVYLNRNILNPNRPQEQLKTLRHKYFTLRAQLGSGGRRHVLRLSIQEKKIRAKVISVIRRISMITQRLNCIAVA